MVLASYRFWETKASRDEESNCAVSRRFWQEKVRISGRSMSGIILLRAPNGRKEVSLIMFAGVGTIELVVV